MSLLSTPTRDEVDTTAKGIFDGLQQALGMVPNLYATIGNSGHILKNYMHFSNSLANGPFNAKEVEAIYLATSQVNNCMYCLAAHTALAQRAGLSIEETVNIRLGRHHDAKLNTLAKLALSVADKRGKPDEQLVKDFYNHGYSEGDLIHLIALVIDKTFTNYVARLGNVKVDFPEAPAAA